MAEFSTSGDSAKRNASFDMFDSVIELEASAYQDGLADGVDAARNGESFDEGRRAGYLRAFALGLEIGFMESVVEALMEKQNDPTKRAIKRQEDCVSRTKAVPYYNSDSIDFDTELRDLRGLYRQCGGSVGQFLRPKGVPVAESNLW